MIQRVRGFEEELAEHHPDVKVVAKLTGRGMKDIAFRTAEDILQAHPDLDAHLRHQRRLRPRRPGRGGEGRQGSAR